MNNIFIIHSYNADTKESFGPYLEREARKKGFNVIFPDFPIRQEATYQKWSNIMDKYLENGLLNENSIIVAHSLGTHFIPKYIANKNIPIKAYISCAGFLNDFSGRDDLKKIVDDFKPNDIQIDSFIKLCKKRFAIYSNNDHMNPQSELEHYAEKFNANKVFIPNIGHLGKASGIKKLPEVMEIINDINRQTRILCYGDSNTWGYISGSDHKRYGNQERWAKILSKLLGNSFEIIEEGLNSRTLISNDTRPGKEGKNGYEYLIPCLDTHDPIDLVIVMLGTNELKSAYNKTSKEIGDLLEQYFVKTILNRKSQIKNSYPKLLLVAPPIVNENTTYCKENNKYLGATQKSKDLNDIYKSIAKKYDCYFLENEKLKTGIDGVHLTQESHKVLAELLNNKIKQIYK